MAEWFNAETNDGDFRCTQLYLAPTVIGLANPNRSANERDVYEDIRGKLAWGALYAYYYWACDYTHRMITAEMFPITVEEIHPGHIKGKERLITLHSGAYGWPGSSDLHLAHLADARGHLVPANFLTTIERAGVRTQVTLKEGETAVLERVPVSVDAAVPINVTLERYDADGIEMTLNGTGRAVVTIRSGEFVVEPNTAYGVEARGAFRVESDEKGLLAFPIELEGQVRLAVKAGA